MVTKIITIEDIYEIKKGVVIGGVNRALDTLTSEEIKKQVGHKISITSKNGDTLTFSVLDVDTSISIIGQRNIYILLPKKYDTSNIKLKDEVYTIDAICEQSASRRYKGEANRP